MKVTAITLMLAGLSTTLLGDNSDVDRLKTSGEVLQEIMNARDKGIPSDLLHKAYCAVVIPNLLKGGFIVSAKYGRGYASCRKADGGWSDPAGMRIEGAGFGLQAGGSATDLVLLVMSKRGMNGMLASKFTLGGEASAAAGPVGRDTTAQTDATMRADILSWSRSRGVFAGVSLQGGTLRPDNDANRAIYGGGVTSAEILRNEVNRPVAANDLTPALNRYAGPRQEK